jgi:hypothetical protein
VPPERQGQGVLTEGADRGTGALRVCGVSARRASVFTLLRVIWAPDVATPDVTLMGALGVARAIAALPGLHHHLMFTAPLAPVPAAPTAPAAAP